MDPSTPHIRSGFTLLEISVVLVIIGVLTAAMMGVFNKTIDDRQLKETQAKIQILQKALQDFAVANNRLPCPSDPKISTDTNNYGKEASSTMGYNVNLPSSYDCLGSNVLGLTGVVSAGMIPVKSLELPDDMGVDGWGRRFWYAMDKTFAAPDAFTNIGVGDTSARITVKDVAGGIKTISATHIVFSAGVNGHGAYKRDGGSIIVNPGGTFGNVDELQNCHCSTTGTPTGGDSIFIQKSQTVDSSFDDMLVFGTRAQFVGSSLNCTDNQKVDTVTHTCVTKTCANDGYGCAACVGQQTMIAGRCADPTCDLLTQNLVAHNCVPKNCTTDFGYDPTPSGPICNSATQTSNSAVTHHATAIGDCPTYVTSCTTKTCTDYGYDPTTTGTACNAATQNENIVATPHSTAIGNCPTNARTCTAKTCTDLGYNPALTGTACAANYTESTTTTNNSTAIGNCPTNARTCTPAFVCNSCYTLIPTRWYVTSTVTLYGASSSCAGGGIVKGATLLTFNFLYGYAQASDHYDAVTSSINGGNSCVFDEYYGQYIRGYYRSPITDNGNYHANDCDNCGGYTTSGACQYYSILLHKWVACLL